MKTNRKMVRFFYRARTSSKTSFDLHLCISTAVNMWLCRIFDYCVDSANFKSEHMSISMHPTNEIAVSGKNVEVTRLWTKNMESDEVAEWGRMIKVKRIVQMEKCGKDCAHDKSIVGSLLFYMTHKIMLPPPPLPLLMMMNKCQFMKQKSPDK